MTRVRERLIVYLRTFLRIVYALRLHRYPALRALLERLASSKSAAVDVADAIALYEHVITRKPTCMLELGRGVSTNVICQAIADVRSRDSRYAPEFSSYEENVEWLRYHENTFAPELREYVNLGSLPASLKHLEGSGRLITSACRACLMISFSWTART